MLMLVVDIPKPRFDAGRIAEDIVFIYQVVGRLIYVSHSNMTVRTYDSRSDTYPYCTQQYGIEICC